MEKLATCNADVATKEKKNKKDSSMVMYNAVLLQTFSRFI